MGVTGQHALTGDFGSAPTALRHTFAALCGGLLAAVMFAAPASAHTGFESSDPTDGAVVVGTINAVTLTFTGTAEPTGEGFVVLDGSGQLRTPTTLESNSDKTEWVLDFMPPLTEGPTGLRWTVKAADTHPISGSLSFVVQDSKPTDEDDEPDADTPVDPEASQTTSNSAANDVAADDEEAAANNQPANEQSAISSQAERSKELEEFLDTDPTAPGAEWVSTAGRLLGLVGTALTIGGLAFAVYVARDRRPDVVAALKLEVEGGLLVATGALTDLVGRLAVENGRWADVWSPTVLENFLYTDYGFAIYLRVIAGIVFTAAAMSQLRSLPLVVATVPDVVRIGGGDGTVVVDKAGPTSTLEERTTGAKLSVLALGATATVLASYAFDGHTVTEGHRWVTAAVNAAHVMAGSIWAGGIIAFAVVAWRGHRRDQPVNGLELAVRFSTVAAASLAVAGIGGTALTAIIVDQLTDLWTTPWGRLVMAKTAVVAVAAAIGGYNHFSVIPSMEKIEGGDVRSTKLRRTVTAEAVLLVAVIAVTAFLVAASSTADIPQ